VAGFGDLQGSHESSPVVQVAMLRPWWPDPDARYARRDWPGCKNTGPNGIWVLYL